MDKHEIVKRLEYCTENKCNICQKENGSGFPLIDGRCYGFTERLYDTLALLKAQEPRLMTLEEVNRHCAKHDPVEISDNQPLYVEYKNNRPWFLHWATVETLESWVIDVNTRAEYGKKWRCWTSHPTDAQREATPWEMK